jgi:hypothetical protein
VRGRCLRRWIPDWGGVPDLLDEFAGSGSVPHRSTGINERHPETTRFSPINACLARRRVWYIHRQRVAGGQGDNGIAARVRARNDQSTCQFVDGQVTRILDQQSVVSPTIHRGDDRRSEPGSDETRLPPPRPFSFGDRLRVAAAFAPLLEPNGHRLTAVPSCHGPGKSFTAGRLVAHFIDTHPEYEAFAVTSAPTDPQVKAILWREIIKAHKRRADSPGRSRRTRTGRSATSSSRSAANPPTSPATPRTRPSPPSKASTPGSCSSCSTRRPASPSSCGPRATACSPTTTPGSWRSATRTTRRRSSRRSAPAPTRPPAACRTAAGT